VLLNPFGEFDMYGSSPDIFQMQTLITNKSLKNARVEARLTEDQKSLIEQATAYEGRSISDTIGSLFHAAFVSWTTT
jgi:hypothetical protein